MRNQFLVLYRLASLSEASLELVLVQCIPVKKGVNLEVLISNAKPIKYVECTPRKADEKIYKILLNAKDCILILLQTYLFVLLFGIDKFYLFHKLEMIN